MDDLNSTTTKSESFSCATIVTKYKCEYCDFKADLWITLNDHVWTSHKRLQSYRSIDFTLKIYTCRSCNWYMSYSKLVWHQHEKRCTYVSKRENNCSGTLFNLEVLEQKLTCEYCDYKTKRKANLDRHIELKHKVDGNITLHYFRLKELFCCKLCAYKARRLLYWERHFLRHHSDPRNFIKYKCDKCLFESVDKRALKGHLIRMHTDPEKIKWFGCNFCEFKTKSKSNLKRHINVTHARKDQVHHECNQCSYKSVFKHHLKRHVIGHHTDPTKIEWFKCDYCEYKAKSKSTLKRHNNSKHL